VGCMSSDRWGPLGPAVSRRWDRDFVIFSCIQKTKSLLSAFRFSVRRGTRAEIWYL
jgi:hypothetical protein